MLTIVGISNAPSNGTAANENGGITYIPNLDFSGSDSFEYTITDNNGGNATATVNVTIISRNDPPVANDDDVNTLEDTAVSIAVLSNDSDVDGDTLTIINMSNPASGTAIADPHNGQNIIYTPNENFVGEDSFIYTITDGNDSTDSATVTVTVGGGTNGGGTNDSPVANDDNTTTNEDNPVTIQVLSNDSDPDGDSLNVAGVTNPSNGTVTNNGGNVIYDPNPDFNGPDTFNYTVEDGNGGTDTATVTITVDPQNDVPVANDDGATTPEDTDVAIDVLGNDSDVDGDSLTVSSVTQPPNGTVTNNGTDVTYSPNTNFNGTDTFNYTINDGNGGTATAIVTVNVGGTNDPPVAGDDSDNTTNEDNPITIQVLSNDIDPDGDSLNVASTTNPANGTVTNNGNSVTYTPDPNFNGTDTFNYTVEDGNGGTDTATVTITVDPQNDVPVANDDGATTPEDTDVTIDVLNNDSDVDGDSLTVSSVTQPSNGRVTNNNTDVTYSPNTNFNGTDTFNYTINDGNGGTATAIVTVNVGGTNDPPVAGDDSGNTTNEDNPITIQVLSNDIDPDGDSLNVASATSPANGTVTNNGNNVTYTPDPNFNGTDTFNYTVEDGNGGTDTATVTITVDPQNDVPVANDDGATTPEDTDVTIDVLGNDSDVDGDSLTVSSVTQPSNGTVTNNNTDVTYSPDANFNGTDTFNYTINDGNGGTATAIVTVNVGGTNDPPVAGDDSDNTTNEDNPITIQVLSNDIDPDGDSLNVASTTNPANGMVTNNGNSVTYTPDPNFNGTDAFNYTVSDGNSGTDTATVNVTVNAVNDNPSFTTTPPNPTSLNINEGDSFTYNAEAIDPDVGDTLTFTGSNVPTWLTFTDNGGGTALLTGAATTNEVGEHVVVLEVSDGSEDDIQFFTIRVNGKPEFTSSPITTATESVNYNYDITTNDPDNVGGELTITAPTLPSWLTLTDNSDGTAQLSGTPDSTHVGGIHNVELEVNDGSISGDLQSFTITVNTFTGCTDPVVFADPNLEAAMRSFLGKPTGDITCAEVEALTSFSAVSANISNLSGLEYAINLQSLDLNTNNISDLTPIANLTGLQQIDLSRNDITDITPLAGLTNLTSIELRNKSSGAGISDLSPLVGLTSLSALDVREHTGLSDLTPLTGLTNLQLLLLGTTNVSNLTPITNLTNMSTLDLSFTPVFDISVLAGFSQLTWLNLRNTSIDDADLSDLSGLTSLQNLDLRQISSISNLTDLAGLTSLQLLYLNDNSISDISPLSSLTNLTDFHLGNNLVSDISALTNLTNLKDVQLHTNYIFDIDALVANAGIGSGDTVDLQTNCLDLTTNPDQANITTLINRGVTVLDSGNPRSECIPWINEFHYNNSGTDVNEFVEVVIRNGLDISNLKIVLYDGTTGIAYDTHLISTFTVGDTVGNYTLYGKLIPGIRNGTVAPDGIAFCNGSNVGEFLSYGGVAQLTFTALDDCADGVQSTSIGVSESSSTPVGNSLQLTGQWF